MFDIEEDEGEDSFSQFNSQMAALPFKTLGKFTKLGKLAQPLIRSESAASRSSVTREQGAVAASQSITFNVTATDAASFKRSEGEIAAMLARTVGRGQRGL